MVKAKTKTKAKSQNKVTKKSTKPRFRVGNVVTFLGYGVQPPEDPLFAEGQDLVIVEIDKSGDEPLLGCIDRNDKTAYDNDPDDIDGEELRYGEVKLKKERVPKKKSKAVARLEPHKPDKVRAIGRFSAIIKESKGDLTKAARKLYENLQENFFYFGGFLYKIYTERHYLPKGSMIRGHDHQAFEEYCRTNFEFGRRKAFNLMKIYEQFSPVSSVSMSRLRKIGWSKAAAIANWIDDANAEDLLKAAESKTVTDLKAYAQTTYMREDGTGPSGKQATRQTAFVKKTSFSYSLYDDQAEQVNFVFDLAQKQLDMGADDVFEHIVTEWAADHLDEKGKKTAVRTSKARKSKKAA